MVRRVPLRWTHCLSRNGYLRIVLSRCQRLVQSFGSIVVHGPSIKIKGGQSRILRLLIRSRLRVSARSFIIMLLTSVGLTFG